MTLRSLTFVEIEVSICSLTYGVAPCTASVPTTGDQKCFNTIGSCQDRANYTETFVTLRFVEDVGYHVQSGIEAIPSLISVDVTPGRIALGEGLGQRTSLSCGFKDHPHSDTGQGFDPYLSTRTYDPYRQGTFWAKFAARHPNLRGKNLRVIRGYLGQALEEMETRHYVVDSIDGPSLDGQFTVTAKDPLKLLDGDRAVAPLPSTGYLNAGINNSATSATLSPSGVGNAEYPASGHLAIGGKEVVSFTRTADALTITRAQWNTTAVAHSTGDRVQLCLEYSADDPAEIIADLETNYATVDDDWIPEDDWLAEVQAHLGQVYSARIAEPTPVKTLTAELIEQAALSHWWDEVGRNVRLQVMRQIDTDTATFDETIYLEKSLRVKAQPEKRFSQIWTYFGLRNPLEPVDDPSNYVSLAVFEDADSEEDYGSPSIKKIFSRWIPAGGRSIAERLNDVQAGRYLVPPREIEFKIIDGEGAVLPELGAGYAISSRAFQAADGSRVNVPIQIVRLKFEKGVLTATGEEMNFTAFGADPYNRPITVDYNVNALNLRTLHDSLYGTPQFGGLVTIEITSAALIGSTGYGTPSLETGTWPSVTRTGNRTSGSPILTGLANTTNFVAGMAVTGTGIPNHSRILSVDSGTQITLDKNATSGSGTATTLTIYTTRVQITHAGDVRGAGAPGGTNSAGAQGGTAFKVTSPVDLILAAAGKLQSGGGGGGSGGRQTYADHQPGGGGGGAGIPGGSGGGGPGPAEDGGAGSSTSGGGGGRSWTNVSGTIFEGPELENDWRGGVGGALGQPGNIGIPTWAPVPPGAAGAQGYAIDGISLLKLTNIAGGTIAGGQVN